MLAGIIKREIKESWESVKNLKADPLGSLGQLIPVAIVVAALIGLIIKEFGFVAVFISLVIIPVSSIMLENAIPIIAGILRVVLYSVGVVLLVGLSLLVLWFMLSGGSGGSSASYESRDIEVNEKMKTADRPAKTEQWIINRNAELRVETTFAGAKVVRAYAQGLFSNKYDDPITFHLYGDPTLDEFRKNKVEIIIQGKKMTEKDLHY